MIKKRKLIATDLDGTLLGYDRNLSDVTKEYMQNLKEEGHIIVVATGRFAASAKTVIGNAEFANYVVSSEGGVIYEVDNDTYLYADIIPDDEVRMIFDIIKDEDLGSIKFGNLDKIYKYFVKDEKVEKEPCTLYYNKNEATESIHNIIRLVIRFDDMQGKTDEYVEILNSHLKNSVAFVMYDSFDKRTRWIEIIGKNATKYDSIRRVANKENIDYEDIITFGDSTNDIDMIKRSAVGVAMENAIDEVKQHADYIAPKNTDDGVVEFLKEFLQR